MDFLLLFFLIFGVGTLLLAKKTKFERHFIVFLIRTRFFLDLIQKIAEVCKKGWKLFADVAIIFSFSGLGAAYLSQYRRENRSLDIILVLMGFFLVLPLALSGGLKLIISLELFICVTLVAGILRNIESRKADFVVFSALISLVWLRVFSLLTQTGLTGKISNPFILNLIALTGGIFGIPGLVILSFLYQGYLIIFQNLNVPGVSPFLPATKGGEVGFSAPGTEIFIPWWYFLMGIIITIISHEFAHGIIAKAHNLNLKSTGLVLLGIIPIGAFVEPDEKELKKRESLERMRVFSVGSFSNFLVALVAFILLLLSPLIIGPYFSDGVTVADTQRGYPAFGVLKKGEIIYQVNSQPTRNVKEFQKVMEKIDPGRNVVLKTNQKKVNLTSVKSPEGSGGSYIGVLLMSHIPGFIHQILFWIFFINFSISLVNLLPVIPLDGGRMLKELVKSFNVEEKKGKKIIYGVITFILILVVVNMWPLFNRLGDFLGSLV